jgi:hypothetical protein
MFNDDCLSFNDLLIYFRAFELIVHLLLQNKVTSLSVDTRSSILASCSDSPIVPARDPFVPWMGAAVSETRAVLADGDHHREMADRLRGLARLTRSPGIRRELVDLAQRCDRRGDHFDRLQRREI